MQLFFEVNSNDYDIYFLLNVVNYGKFRLLGTIQKSLLCPKSIVSKLDYRQL